MSSSVQQGSHWSLWLLRSEMSPVCSLPLMASVLSFVEWNSVGLDALAAVREMG